MLTANLPDESLPAMSEVTKTGVYYGYAQVSPIKNGETLLSEEDGRVFPMVMSLGWNPFYKNRQLTAVRQLVFTQLAIFLILNHRKSMLCTNSRGISTAMA